MVIIIGNQKGGAGKSTLTFLLANYLTKVRQCNVTVIDMDYQQSLSQKFQKAKLLDNPEAYQVMAANLEQYPAMEKVLSENPHDIVLVDLPGKLDDDGLIPVFRSADMVICPFCYDQLTYDSTVLFALVLRSINPEAEITFIPNRIKANVRYETKVEVDEQLAIFGRVISALPDRVHFQRVTTFRTPEEILEVAGAVFDEFYQYSMAFLLEGIPEDMEEAGDD
jgi:chromosome partitioning protein